MARLENLWVDGQSVIHYVVDAHVSGPVKVDIFDTLVRTFPDCGVIVISYLDGTIATHKKAKAPTE